MKVNDRSKLLLSDIIKNDTITLEELGERHNLSQRQVDYSIQKMNEFLEEREIPSIIKKSDGRFQLDKRIYTLFRLTGEQSKEELFVTDSFDRANLILLIMLVKDEDFSINYFKEAFKISKNTVLSDLKQAKNIIKPLHLTISYSRVNGYQVNGKEWDIRNAMIHSINTIMDRLDGERYLKHFLKISEEQAAAVQRNLTAVEKRLDLSFVDTKMVVLPYIFISILSRIKLGYHITGIFFIDYDELADTREFDAVNVLIKDTVIPEEEKMYLALHLLSSNIYQSESPLTEELPQLREVISTFIDEFERVAFTSLSGKESLVNKIFIHFKPAYYRIKYQLTTDYKLLPMLDTEYGYIHNLIKEAIDPISSYLGRELPQIETMFLSMLIGAHLVEQSNQLDAKFRGIVVCQNGLAFSNLLASSLKKIFPELFFYPPMSLKELQANTKPYDLIFTSVPLESDKPVFFIPDLSKQLNIADMRSKVFSVLYHLDGMNVTIEDIILTTAKHAKSLDTEKLRTELLEVFMAIPAGEDFDTELEEDTQLSQLLVEETITKVTTVKNWFEALDLVSLPLISQNAVSEKYVATIKEEQPALKSDIILRENIAIPHTSPEIETRLGMSLLLLEKPLIYEDNKKIHYIVMIASPNKKAHFRALLELLEIAEDTLFLKKLRTCSTKEIANEIKHYRYLETNEGGVN